MGQGSRKRKMKQETGSRTGRVGHDTTDCDRAFFFPISLNSCFVDMAESRAWLNAWAFFPPFIRHEMRRGRLEKASESLSRISHGSKINYT